MPKLDRSEAARRRYEMQRLWSAWAWWWDWAKDMGWPTREELEATAKEITALGKHPGRDLRRAYDNADAHHYPNRRRPGPDEVDPFGPRGEFQVVGPDGEGGWTTKPRSNR